MEREEGEGREGGEGRGGKTGKTRMVHVSIPPVVMCACGGIS